MALFQHFAQIRYIAMSNNSIRQSALVALLPKQVEPNASIEMSKDPLEKPIQPLLIRPPAKIPYETDLEGFAVPRWRSTRVRVVAESWRQHERLQPAAMTFDIHSVFGR